MRLFPFFVQTGAMITKWITTCSRLPVVRFNIISFSAFVIIMVNRRSWKFRVEWRNFHKITSFCELYNL